MLPIGLKFLKFAKEADLASLISDIDDLDIDKLKTVSFDLYELSNVAENDNIKKLYMMNWLKNLILFKLLMLLIKLKKLIIIQKLVNLKGKYLTI